MDTNEQIDDGLEAFTALGARVLRPDRPRLADALEVITGIEPDQVREAVASPAWAWHNARAHNGLSWRAYGPRGKAYSAFVRSPRDRLVDPREAWEMLAARGVIPDDWVDSRERRFFNGFHGTAPPTVGAAVTLAADPEGVIAVEALAHEAAQRLAPWLFSGPDAAPPRQPPRVLWRIHGPAGGALWGPGSSAGGAAVQRLVAMCSVAGLPAPRPDSARPSARRRANDPEWFALDVTGNAVVAGAGRRDGPVYTAALLATAAARWRAGASAGESRPAGAGLARVELARHPDPFEPLLGIWARGYALADLTSKTLTLVAGEVGERW